MEVYVARQPIFDQANEVHAYELLYRQNEQNFFDQSVTSNVATSLLLMNSYYTFGIDKLAGEGKVFINFDKSLITSGYPLLLDKNKVVIELLEDIVPDKQFIESVKKLKAAGYTIALDDYVESYEYMELVELSNIIKVDFLENTEEQIINIARRWKRSKKILLAEKVETQEIYEWAKKLGYKLFQGYYFSKPKMLKGKSVEDSAFQFIKIMEELCKTEPNYKAISSIIEIDVNLTYKLLKLVNSNFVGATKITSIQHGLSVLGIATFEKWISLAMVKSMAEDKPQESVKVSMSRGKFMELIAKNTKLKNKANEMMMVGILSVIDGLVDKPMGEIVEELPLKDEVKKALLLQEGHYTKSFKMVLKFEKGLFEESKEYYKELKIPIEKISQLYYEAIEWSESMFSIMGNY